MKFLTRLLIVLLMLQHSLCAQEPEDYGTEAPAKFPLKSMETACVIDTLQPVFIHHYRYDEKHRLVAATSFNKGAEAVLKKEYQYNSKGLLVEIYSYVLSGASRLQERRLKLEYDEQQHLVSKHYEGGEPLFVNTYNEKGQLSYRTTYYMNQRTDLRYEYDSEGRLVKSYQSKGGFVFIHSFEYKDRQLLTEKLVGGANPQDTEYEYTAEGLLSSIAENGRVVQKNTYKNGRLVERRLYNYSGDEGTLTRCPEQVQKYQYD